MRPDGEEGEELRVSAAGDFVVDEFFDVAESGGLEQRRVVERPSGCPTGWWYARRGTPRRNVRTPAEVRGSRRCPGDCSRGRRPFRLVLLGLAHPAQGEAGIAEPLQGSRGGDDVELALERQSGASPAEVKIGEDGVLSEQRLVSVDPQCQAGGSYLTGDPRGDGSGSAADVEDRVAGPQVSGLPAVVALQGSPAQHLR